jgi:hypothetical protein
MPERRSVMIRRYTMTGDMDDLMRKVDARFAGQLDAAPGTDVPVRLPPGILGYQAVRTGDHTLLTITVFASDAHRERAQRGAQDIRRSLAEFDVAEVETFAGDVMISRMAEELLEPVRP